MKKFNFLSVLVVALLMFLGNNIQAQDFVPSNKAMYIVQNDVETLSNSSAAQATNGVLNAQALITQLKIAVGNEIIPLLKTGSTVESALTTAVSKFRSNDQTRNAKVSEVDLYYRNLLRKPF
jgi:hypothetical protein